MNDASKSSPKIKIRGLKKSFGNKHILRGIDLDVGVGESVVVIGGSGTGKSVLLKCVLGILDPDEGSIEIDGREVTTLSRREREKVMNKFGMLFQGAALFDSLPVWENVSFGLLQVDRMGRDEARKRRSRRLPRSGSARMSPISRHRNFQAACKSASGLRAPSRDARKSFSSTSRPQASIRSWPMSLTI